MYINKSTNQTYYGGALYTANGVIFNPTPEVLKANGFEPYTPPAPEPIPAEEQRRLAYVAECDPYSMAYVGYMLEGNEEAAAECKAQYLIKKSEIRERIPDEEG